MFEKFKNDCCCYDLHGKQFSFKLDLYFMRYMHGNIKNEMWVPKRILIF